MTKAFNIFAQELLKWFPSVFSDFPNFLFWKQMLNEHSFVKISV